METDAPNNESSFRRLLGRLSRRLSEAATDPGSGQWSASRIVFLTVNLVYMPFLVAAAALSQRVTFSEVVRLVLGLNAAPAIVYGVNSAIGRLRAGATAPEQAEPAKEEEASG